MESRWKLREPYFRGPGKYKIGPEAGQLEIEVDELSYFHLNQTPDFLLTVFAENRGTID